MSGPSCTDAEYADNALAFLLLNQDAWNPLIVIARGASVRADGCLVASMAGAVERPLTLIGVDRSCQVNP